MLPVKLCKDCGTALQGIYCHSCGQKDTEIFSLKTLLSEFVNSLFSIDSKLFITLKNLLFKPGFLTKEYWDGKRSRYISPIRIYLVISFIMFAVLPLSLNFLNVGKGSLFEASENTQLPPGYTGVGIFIPLIEEFERDSVNNEPIIKLLKDGIEETIRRKITVENIFFTVIPLSMFILMPVFAVFLYMILFRSKHLTYVHHLITVLHLHSVTFIFLLVFMIFEYLGLHSFLGEAVLFYFWPIFAVTYLGFFLKNIYHNSWIKTVFKSVILGSVYLVTIIWGIIYIMFFAMVLFGQPAV